MNNRCIFRSRSFIILGIDFGWIWARFGKLLGIKTVQNWYQNPLGRSGGLSGCLGVVLGSSWGGLGASWGGLGVVLGRLGAVLGRLGAVSGRLGAVLGSSVGVLGSSRGSKGTQQCTKRQPRALNMSEEGIKT